MEKNNAKILLLFTAAFSVCEARAPINGSALEVISTDETVEDGYVYVDIEKKNVEELPHMSPAQTSLSLGEDPNSLNVNSEKQIFLSDNAKFAIKATCVVVTTGLVAFYAPPILYHTGFAFAQAAVPTTGLSYYLIGLPAYTNFGLQCSTSTTAQTAISAAAGIISYGVSNVAIYGAESTYNMLFGKKN